MKYLKHFESLTSDNDKWIELSEILKSRVFDDFNVLSKTDEEFNDESPAITHKFWAFQTRSGMRNLQELESFKKHFGQDQSINHITVYSIPDSEKDEFLNSLESIKGLVEDFTGKALVIGDVEEVVDGQWHIWDVVINLK